MVSRKWDGLSSEQKIEALQEDLVRHGSYVRSLKKTVTSLVARVNEMRKAMGMKTIASE